MANVAISVEHISKAYHVYQKPSDRLKELLLAGSRAYHLDFWALRDVSFEVRRGSTVGIVGRNGSGKSTLLQIVAGTVPPTSGRVRVEGRIAALLELGTGFNPEFTGRENVLLNGAILGLSRAEMRSRLPQIMEFAELGPFFDQPVKTYSSGMQVRLAFATAISVDPDILVVDEALAVGDVAFQHRCMRRIHELKARGVTVLFVSHSPEVVKMLCDEAVLLEDGLVYATGSAEEVVNKYLALLFSNKPLAISVPDTGPGLGLPRPERSTFDEANGPIEMEIERSDGRYGNGAARVLGVEAYDEQGRKTRRVLHGSSVTIRLSARFDQFTPQPILGITMRNSQGVDVTRTNTQLEGLILPPARPGDVLTAEFRLRLPYLHPGSYAISPAVANGTTSDFQMCDWIENALLLYVTAQYEVHGQLRVPASVRAFRTVVPQGAHAELMAS